ncbi:Zinc finger protein 717 [Lemmus lemmus]
MKMSKDTLERNITNVVTLRTLSLLNHTFQNIRKSTEGKSPMNVKYVGSAFIGKLASTDIIVLTLGKSPMSVMNVGKLSAKSHTLLSIREFIRVRDLIYV